MAHFEQTHSNEPVNEAEAARCARIGLVLFAVYSVIYSVFVLLNAFAPSSMETLVAAGVNLAVVYGIGLIVWAFLLAVLYAWLCRSEQPA